MDNSNDKLDILFNDKLNDDLIIFSRQLNNIFKNTNDNIYKMIFDINGKLSRNNKLTFNDAVIYLFNYCFKHKTKNEVVSFLNFDNNINVHPSNYQKKEAKIPLSFYQNLFYKIQNLFYEKYTFNDSKQHKIISVDGTYNNTNLLKDGSLETSLNMGYYDFTNKIPINIILKGIQNKNKEIKSFIEDIDKKNISTDNIIFVFDRAYCCYDFINYLDKNNYNYVIRIKKSCLYLDKETNENKIKKNKKKIKNENVRFITHKHKYDCEVRNNKNKKIKISKTTECHLITNLDIKKYNDEKIKEIYINRWSVETFFKLLKLNFKFSNLISHNKDKTKNQYDKQNYIILIQYYTMRIIENIYSKNINDLNKHKFSINNKKKYVIKHNVSLMIKGLEKIIKNIVNSNVDNIILFNYITKFVKKINIQIGIYNERRCKTPGFKWYLKSYAEYYKNNTIINALINDNVDNLNKNLKLFSSEIEIIK